MASHGESCPETKAHKLAHAAVTLLWVSCVAVWLWHWNSGSVDFYICCSAQPAVAAAFRCFVCATKKIKAHLSQYRYFMSFRQL